MNYSRILIPELHTDRLTLNMPVESDFDGYASIVCGERGVHIGGPFTLEEAWLDFAQMTAGWIWRGYGALSIRTRGQSDYLGTVLVHHEFGDPEPELGALLTLAAEGRGIAAEAGAAMLAWAWENTTLESLCSYTDPDNERAIRALGRAGALRVDGPEGVATYRHRRPVR